MTRLPTLFISHGSPMHAVDAGGAGQAWRALADALPRPRAILIASAHWETALPMLTGAEKLETIHDFGGFPAELYKIRYDASGSPELANEAAALFLESWALMLRHGFEQFGLEKRFRKRRAVDRDEGPVLPWGIAVNQPRDHLFAGP